MILTKQNNIILLLLFSIIISANCVHVDHKFFLLQKVKVLGGLLWGFEYELVSTPLGGLNVNLALLWGFKGELVGPPPAAALPLQEPPQGGAGGKRDAAVPEWVFQAE